ncbi:hypothetical protein M9435_004995 [Picochlorum sp. BPE23]|nr:hypothetical protein M9435_004995 [Picochlorum sp. BPE23]
MPRHGVKSQQNEASVADWPSVKATSTVTGNVLGVSPGASTSEIVVTVPSDGVSVMKLDKTFVQSWIFNAEGDEECSPTGPACFQKNGGFFCVPMRQSRGRGRKSVYFLYVWNVEDVESKSIRHVSKKVEVAAEVAFVVPVACPRKRSQSRGFYIVLDDGNVLLMDSDTGRVEDVCRDSPVVGKTILFASCVPDGLVIVHEEKTSKQKPQSTCRVSKILFTSYPKMEVEGTCRLSLNENSVGGIACDCGKRVSIVSPSGEFMVYNLPISLNGISEDLVIEPSVTRTLVNASAGETSLKKKRQQEGKVNSEFRVFMDGVSRIYVLQNVNVDTMRLHIIDAQYGSVLWSGTVDKEIRSGEPVTQAILYGEALVDMIVSCKDGGILHVNMNIPKPSLSALVGSFNIQSTLGDREVRNILAMNARRALDLEANSVGTTRTKQLGRVQIGVEPGDGGNELVHVPTKFSWKPAMNKELMSVETEITDILEGVHPDLKMDAKTKSKLLKCIIGALDRCKKSKCSLSSNVAARILAVLIELKQWDSIGSLLHYSHPRSLSHCPGAALVLAENARYSDLFALLSQASDIRSSELCSVVKSLIGGAGPLIEKSRESYMASLSSLAEEQLKALEKSSKKAPIDSLDNNKLIEASCCAAAVHGFSKRQISCHPILTLYPNPILISMALKRMHSEYLIFLIRYLMQWVSNIIDLDLSQGGVIPNLSPVPSLETVLIWLSAAMDAGNMRLTNSEKGLEVLQKLMDEVSSQVSCLRMFENLAGVLSHVQHASPSKQRQNNMPGYKIQCLSL